MALYAGTDVTEVTEQSQLHLLPCEVEYNGPAKTSQYFHSSICGPTSKPDGYLTASFRGRPLMGEEVTVPSGYKGVILHEDKIQEQDEGKMKVVNKFDKFIYWNLDQIPSKDDPVQQALVWLHMASVLHQPVDDDDGR